MGRHHLTREQMLSVFAEPKAYSDIYGEYQSNEFFERKFPLLERVFSIKDAKEPLELTVIECHAQDIDEALTIVKALATMMAGRGKITIKPTICQRGDYVIKATFDKVD